MDESINQKRIHTLLNARWTYFHTNVFIAAMFLDSEFITDKHTLKEEKEFRAVLELMAATPGCLYTYCIPKTALFRTGPN